MPSTIGPNNNSAPSSLPQEVNFEETGQSNEITQPLASQTRAAALDHTQYAPTVPQSASASPLSRPPVVPSTRGVDPQVLQSAQEKVAFLGEGAQSGNTIGHALVLASEGGQALPSAKATPAKAAASTEKLATSTSNAPAKGKDGATFSERIDPEASAKRDEFADKLTKDVAKGKCKENQHYRAENNIQKALKCSSAEAKKVMELMTNDNTKGSASDIAVAIATAGSAPKGSEQDAMRTQLLGSIDGMHKQMKNIGKDGKVGERADTAFSDQLRKAQAVGDSLLMSASDRPTRASTAPAAISLETARSTGLKIV